MKEKVPLAAVGIIVESKRGGISSDLLVSLRGSLMAVMYKANLYVILTTVVV